MELLDEKKLSRSGQCCEPIYWRHEAGADSHVTAKPCQAVEEERARITRILDKQPDHVWSDITGVLLWLDAGAPDVPDIYEIG